MPYDHKPQNVGPIRLIILKSNETRDFSKRKTTIIGMDVFVEGFLCGKQSRYAARNWCSEEIDLIEPQIEDELKGEGPGFYELVADFYYHGWTSYESEYDSEAELRNIKFQPISYDAASCFDDYDILKESEKISNDLYGYTVSYYMTKHQIMVNYANILSYLNAESRRVTHCSSPREVDDFIFCTTIQLDARVHTSEEFAAEVQRAHDTVRQVLALQAELMGT